MSTEEIGAVLDDITPTFNSEDNSNVDLPVVPFAAVAGDEPRAVLIARDILAKGGSAADAAVALYFAMAVTFPSTASLGGGGVCLVQDPSQGTVESLDFTVRMPAAVPPTADRPSGVPGAIRGMFALHSRFGTRDWSMLLEPAEKLARAGTPVSRALARDLRLVGDGLLVNPAARDIFAGPDGKPLGEGEKLEQLDLAVVLTNLRINGAGDFYGGQLAAQLVAAVEAAGGSLSRGDLSGFQVDWRPAISMNLADHVIYLPQPPASGGFTAVQILLMLMREDRYRQASLSDQGHLFVEAAMRAFADRAQWLEPSGALAQPADEILARSRIDALLRDFDPTRHTDPLDLVAPPAARAENPAAASFVAIDNTGLAVACSVSTNNLFGTGRIARGTGLVLAAAPNRPGVGPSPLAPVIVRRASDARLVMAATASGGPAAATAFAWTAAKVFAEGKTLRQAMAAPRLHHGGMPDRVLYEPNIDRAAIRALQDRGHKTVPVSEIGRINAIYCPGGLQPIGGNCEVRSDRRGNGMAMGIGG